MKNETLNEEHILLKPYSAKELSLIYGVEKRTFIKWIEPFAPDIGPRQGRFYTVLQVRTIFLKLGLPGPVPVS